jgi:hypothetical protein
LAIRVNGSLLVKDFQTQFQYEKEKGHLGALRSWGLYGMEGKFLEGDVTSEDVEKFMKTFLDQKTF